MLICRNRSGFRSQALVLSLVSKVTFSLILFIIIIFFIIFDANAMFDFGSLKLGPKNNISHCFINALGSWVINHAVKFMKRTILPLSCQLLQPSFFYLLQLS